MSNSSQLTFSSFPVHVLVKGRGAMRAMTIRVLFFALVLSMQSGKQARAISLPLIGSANPLVHYDPDNIQLVPSTTEIATWVNSGTAGATLDAVSTAGSRPTLDAGAANGFDASSFSGAHRLKSGALSTLVAQPITVFHIGRFDNITSAQYWYDGLNETNRVAEFISGGNPTILAPSLLSSTTTAPVGSSFHIWAASYNTTSSFNSIDGTVIASGTVGSGSFEGFTIGARNSNIVPLFGDLAELIVFDGLLSPEDFDLIGGYLAFKYDISGTEFSEFTPPVPEPSTGWLLGLGIFALARAKRTRRKRSSLSWRSVRVTC